MNDSTEKDLAFYKEFDPAQSHQIKHPLIEKLQANKRLAEQNFDDDVLSWVSTQDLETKRHINDVIRHIMAVKQTVA